MTKIDQVLVTGGAGFVGSHTVDALVDKGYAVRVLDNLDPQVHGKTKKPPAYLNNKAEFLYGDVRNRSDIIKALEDIDAVLHLAAKVGVGQSMYQIEDYTESNTLGTANLLDVLTNEENNVKKLVVASSMSIYGEGKYLCEKCGPIFPSLRSEEQMKKCDWEQKCPNCGRTVKPIPVDEEKPLQPTSVYAQTKRHQEEMCLLIGETYGIPTVALRYFNIYGPRQALSNPYTGCMAIFTARLLNNKPPIIFEDGKQIRDFIYVKDIANANITALEKEAANYQYFNVGTGKMTSILEVAEKLAKLSKTNLRPMITNRFRAGDVRHVYANISKIKQIGFQPKYTFEQGLSETLNWVRKQSLPKDSVELALHELEKHGLVK